MAKLPRAETGYLPATILLVVGKAYMITCKVDVLDGLVEGATKTLELCDWRSRPTEEDRPGDRTDNTAPPVNVVRPAVRWMHMVAADDGDDGGLGSACLKCLCLQFDLKATGKLIIMVLFAFTGPFVGLMFLAIAFPFVQAKSVQSGSKPPPMPVTLKYCPENITIVSNVTTLASTP
ncbi:hypothetical protein MRX96_049266, partial [Rhipicephalus microplus]